MPVGRGREGEGRWDRRSQGGREGEGRGGKGGGKANLPHVNVGSSLLKAPEELQHARQCLKPSGSAQVTPLHEPARVHQSLEGPGIS